MVARGGVEPPTFRFSVGRSYQLSYLAGTTNGTTGPEPRAGPRDAPRARHGQVLDAHAVRRPADAPSRPRRPAHAAGPRRVGRAGCRHPPATFCRPTTSP